MPAQSKNTNWVYVVSLGMGMAEITTAENQKRSCGITYLDIVKKYNNIAALSAAEKADGQKNP